MDGLLVIDKPVGPTSHDVVARMRRALREKRIGHTGTLDPMASGVLPLVVGVATRLARFHSASAKRYRATIVFGATTDTYDALGTVTWRAPDDVAPPSRAAVEDALAAFRGTFAQVPPAYSAKKIDGDRAYDLARKGTVVVLESVTVTVEALSLVSWLPGGQVLKNAAMKDVTPSAVLEVTCGAGFYVRALAHDLGQALGCGAFLAALRRTASGLLDESLALPLDTAEREPERPWPGWCRCGGCCRASGVVAERAGRRTRAARQPDSAGRMSRIRRTDSAATSADQPRRAAHDRGGRPRRRSPRSRPGRPRGLCNQGAVLT